MRHEIVSRNPDVEVRFYLSVDEGSYVAPHWHDSLELVYMLEGSITVTTENQKNVLQAGEFNIINSRVMHSVLSGKNRALVLQIPKEMLTKYIPDIDDLLLHHIHGIYFHDYIHSYELLPAQTEHLQKSFPL